MKNLLTIPAGTTDTTVNSEPFTPYDDAVLFLPGSHNSVSLALDTAVGYVQVNQDPTSDDGDWVDYVDGNDGEQFTEAAAKAVRAPGMQLRVQFRSVSTSTAIPRLYVTGNVA